MPIVAINSLDLFKESLNVVGEFLLLGKKYKGKKSNHKEDFLIECGREFWPIPSKKSENNDFL